MASGGHCRLAAHLKLPQSSYVCVNCQLRASRAVRTSNPSVTLPYASHRHASWFDSEKLRKKLWKTETPPGQKDPYVKESVFDQRRREREEEREQERENSRDIEPVKPKDQADYVEATTSEGLEILGEPGWETSEWKAENQFRGFKLSERKEGQKDIILAIHRALVETFALKEAGLAMVMEYYPKDPTEDYAERVARGAKFGQDANGQTVLKLQSEELRASILECVTPQERSSDGGAMEDPDIEREETEEMDITEEEIESSEAEERPSQIVEGDEDMDLEFEGSDLPIPNEESFDPARSSDHATFRPAGNTWRYVSLEDAAIKFAVLKRVMQLTGRRIPDPEISAMSTPNSLCVHLGKKPKPKKIAEALLQSNGIVALPNVQILDKRYSLMERETEVGRWKVIKEELEKRGLPVLGRADARKALRDAEQ